MELIQAQDQLVTAVARAAPSGGWERIVADVEIEEGKDGYRIDSVSFAIVRSAGGDYSDPQFELDGTARNAVVDLYTAQKTTGEKGVIGGFELQIEPSGKYRFTYSYDRPKRLNGEWDEAKESRLDNYLDHYLAEQRGAH